jgi:hypothetical protein
MIKMRNVKVVVVALLASCSSAFAGDTFTPQLFDNVGFNVTVTYGPNGNFGLPGATEGTSSSPQIDPSGFIVGPSCRQWAQQSWNRPTLPVYKFKLTRET